MDAKPPTASWVIQDYKDFKPADMLGSRYVITGLNAPFVRKQILALIPGLALKQISVGAVKSQNPIPPSEQSRIVAEVQQRFSVVEELNSVVYTNLKRATCLRQAALQAALNVKLY